MKPVTPDEVAALQTKAIPEGVIAAFNEAIAEDWNGRIATVKQPDVVARIIEKMPDVSREQIFERKWLNIERAYQAAGWTVTYDSPGFNESYAPFWNFKRA